MNRLLVGAVAFAATAALAGCGGGTGGAASETAGPAKAAESDRSSPAAKQPCAAAVTPIPRPTALPQQVPLPPDAKISGAEQRSGRRLVVTAVTPTGFRETLAFMQRAYPAAGLTLTEGEVEDRDAESNFAGNGLVGRWTLREIPDCDGDTLVTVLVAQA